MPLDELFSIMYSSFSMHDICVDRNKSNFPPILFVRIVRIICCLLILASCFGSKLCIPEILRYVLLSCRPLLLVTYH